MFEHFPHLMGGVSVKRDQFHCTDVNLRHFWTPKLIVDNDAALAARSRLNEFVAYTGAYRMRDRDRFGVSEILAVGCSVTVTGCCISPAVETDSDCGCGYGFFGSDFFLDLFRLFFTETNLQPILLATASSISSL